MAPGSKEESKLRRFLTYISIPTVVAVIWFFFQLNTTAQDSLKRTENNKENIQILSRTTKEDLRIQQQTIYELAKLTSKVGDQLDLLLRLGQITQSMFEDLRMIPKSPVDSLGNVNYEWYLIGENEIYIIKVPDSCDASVLKIPIGE